MRKKPENINMFVKIGDASRSLALLLLKFSTVLYPSLKINLHNYH